MKPVAAFHFETGASVGEGHRIRCQSLASRLAAEFQIVMPDVGGPVDLLVVDGYGIANEWILDQQSRARCILQIEDTPRGAYVADAILNPSQDASPDHYPALPHTAYRFGNRYRLLRKEFTSPIPDGPREGIWFAPGGTDAAGISPRWVRWLIANQSETVRMALSESTDSNLVSELCQIESQHQDRFVVHLGADAATMVQMMDRCRLAICTASGVFWEALSRQLPIATGVVAENQVGVYETACGLFGATGLGDLRGINQDVLHRFIETSPPQADRNPVQLETDWADWCTSLIRVPRLRSATIDDATRLYDWAMDPIVRLQSLHPATFPFEDHVRWLEERLHSPDCRMFIAEWKAIPCGMIRFDRISMSEWKLNYLLDVKHRGHRLSHGLVSGGARAMRGNSLIAQVKPENIASLTVFRSAGWDEQIHGGLHHFRLTRAPIS